MSDVDVILTRLESVREQLNRIEVCVEQTNSRLWEVEKWRAHVEGAGASLQFVPPVISAVIAAVLVQALNFS